MLFLKVLNLTVSQGTIDALILYANIVGAMQGDIIFPERGTSILKVFIAWLNLDLGFETCFYDGLNGYGKAWLQFVFPIYVWCIAALIIVASHYFSLAGRIFGHNSVPVLATLFLLSYAKLLRTIIAILSFTFLEHPGGSKVSLWTYDGNVRYLSPAHLPLFLVALGFLLFLWLPYTTILLFRQWLQRVSNFRCLRWIARLKPFFDAYHGPFKSKHRYWVGLMLILRVILFLCFALNPITSSSFNLLLTSIIAISLLLYTTIVGQVYRKRYLTLTNSSSIFNLAVLCVGTLYIQTAGGNQTLLVYVSASFEFVKFAFTVAFHVYMSAKNSRQLRNFRQKLKLKMPKGAAEQENDNIFEIEQSEMIERREPVKQLNPVSALNEPLLLITHQTEGTR